jgi:hypothetical protein
MRRFISGRIFAGIAAGLLVVHAPLAAQGTAGPCEVFPPADPWNVDISAYPVHPLSSTFIESIDLGSTTKRLHADFGTNPEYGIPYVYVSPSQPLVPITYDAYGDQSDPGPFPIPPDAPIEGGAASGGDRHVLVIDTGRCRLYELFAARKDASGAGWTAESGAVFDFLTTAYRPDGWTSADAAGLPIFPGLVRYEEIAAGSIDHAVRFTARFTQRGWIHPARHHAGRPDTTYPPMGLRLRLRADFDVSGYTGASRIILEALKKYGMILADNGSSWFISGASDPRFDNDDLDQLKSVPGSAFEAVYTGEIKRTPSTSSSPDDGTDANAEVSVTPGAIEVGLASPRGRIDVELVDVAGAIVLRRVVEASAFTPVRFSTIGLPAGIYFCRVTVGDRVSVRRVVICG